MDIFKLPDLGEGLPDAEIHEWFVKEGDTVSAYQPLVSMETAKALVDVPSPQNGRIVKCYGRSGDIIKTGAPLVAFEAADIAQTDQGTVVGHLEESHTTREDTFHIATSNRQRPKATLATRLAAKRLGVDLNTLTPKEACGVLTVNDLPSQDSLSHTRPGFEPLRGVRRAMQSSMSQSHQHIVPVSLFDEVDIHAWPKTADITVRLIRALSHACHQEPTLNAWFDTPTLSRKTFELVHVGLAMDHAEGLFVPVLQDVDAQTDEDLRQTINDYKRAVADRNLTNEQLKGATITLSNFGKFAGRFASPIIVPPTVAILATGRVYQGAVVTPTGNLEAHSLLPLSLSFDHRAVTGGEATRFLGAVIAALKTST